mmetsp:Transcript_65878/g.214400  ORF Transcript_65878/g.214400 Transcript_65878/m.214400 type:complete len:389 (+) Transcript_65878:761-1927(+)
MVQTTAAKATLLVETIRPAPEVAHRAILVPKIQCLGLKNPECASAPRRSHRGRARHVFEWPLLTEAALLVDTVGQTTELTCRALVVPIIWDERFVHKRALLEAIVFRRACIRVAPLTSDNISARHICVGVVPTKAALLVDAVSPATQLAHLARAIPEVGHERLVREMAAGGRARDLGIVACSAEAALNILPICLAAHHAHLARRVPKEARGRRVDVKRASTGGGQLRLGRRRGLCRRRGLRRRAGCGRVRRRSRRRHLRNRSPSRSQSRCLSGGVCGSSGACFERSRSRSLGRVWLRWHLLRRRVCNRSRSRSRCLSRRLRCGLCQRRRGAGCRQSDGLCCGLCQRRRRVGCRLSGSLRCCLCQRSRVSGCRLSGGELSARSRRRWYL